MNSEVTMCRLKMVDTIDKDIKEEKLRFIEVLLTVGGIIGAIRIKPEDHWMNAILGVFLVGSLLYFFQISTPRYSKVAIFLSALLSSFFFPFIAVSPLISWNPETYYESISNLSIPVISATLFLFILINLLRGLIFREDSHSGK